MNSRTVSKGQFRLIRALYEQIVVDLSRPHPFAFERVGFLFSRQGTGDNGVPLVLAVDYAPVADADYESSEEPDVGAQIGTAAVRSVMQRIYATGDGAWHVHLHGHKGRPRFSSVDLGSLPPLVQAFGYAAPGQLHGALLLSNNYATATTWLANQTDDTALASVSIVGYPLSIYRRV